MENKKLPHLMDNEELHYMIDLHNCMDFYINAHSGFKSLFDDFKKKYISYLHKLQDEVSARISYGGTLKSGVDPYIAGGAASALFGGTAGVYTASSIAHKNNLRQQHQSYYKNQVNDACSDALNILEELRTITKKIEDEFNSISKEKQKTIKKAVLEYKIKKLKNEINTISEKEGRENLVNVCGTIGIIGLALSLLLFIIGESGVGAIELFVSLPLVITKVLYNRNMKKQRTEKRSVLVRKLENMKNELRSLQ